MALKLSPTTNNILSLLKKQRFVILVADNNKRSNQVFDEILELSKIKNDIRVYERTTGRREIIIINTKESFPESYLI